MITTPNYQAAEVYYSRASYLAWLHVTWGQFFPCAVNLFYLMASAAMQFITHLYSLLAALAFFKHYFRLTNDHATTFLLFKEI
jgi:hypothetical protein